MRYIFIAALHIILFLCINACRPTDREGSTYIPMQRLDKAMAQYPYSSQLQRSEMIDSFRPGISAWLAMAYPSGGDIDSLVGTWARSEAVRVFSPDIETHIQSLADNERILAHMASVWNDYFAEEPFPRYVYGIVSPYNQSIFIADSVVLIGLNHYLGSNYPGYDGMERYVRMRKQIRRMAPDVAEALVRTYFPFADSFDAPLVSGRMLYEGIVAHAVMLLTGEDDIAEILGYDEEDTGWLNDNEQRIWRKLIESEYLYSSDPEVASRLVRAAPSTPLIHPDAPGGVGRYIGYRIIESFRRRYPDITVKAMLSPEFYGSLTPLRESRYNGK